METPVSLASGSGGKLLGTERLSAFPSFVQTRAGASGQTFAQEVERAVERAHGDGLQEKRLDELEGKRREARRAGFGRERPAADEAEGETRAAEAAFRSEHAPVSLQPAAAARLAADGFAQSKQASSAPSMCSSCAEPRPGAPMESVGSAGVAPVPNVTPVAAASAILHLLREQPAVAGAQASEAQPVDLPQPARPAGKAVRPASSSPPSTGPDPAVLERAAEILRQIQLHATPGVRRLTLDLEPAELGRLSVQLALRAGKVAAIVRGEKPETLELLRQREADLLQVLAQRGIAADAVRFELGFGGSRSKRETRSPATTVAAPSRAARSIPSTAPGDRSAPIDFYA